MIIRSSFLETEFTCISLLCFIPAWQEKDLLISGCDIGALGMWLVGIPVDWLRAFDRKHNSKNTSCAVWFGGVH